MPKQGPQIDRSALLQTFLSELQSCEQTLLQAMVESYVDGILILSESGELLCSNEFGRQVCTQLSQLPNPFANPEATPLPAAIWQTCQALMDSHTHASQQPIVLESKIALPETTLRVRVRWLGSETNAQAYLLVLLEDWNQAVRNLSLAEVDRYGLSPREAEVWVLRRLGYTSEQIAAELFISLHTVKKHLKSIQAKRKAAPEADRSPA